MWLGMSLPATARKGIPETTARVFRRSTLERLFDCSHGHLSNLINDPAQAFPRPIQLGSRAKAWVATEVEEWIARRVRERDHVVAEGQRK
jgi:predicted DNA-binding transcriptional regulator AlpA